MNRANHYLIIRRADPVSTTDKTRYMSIGLGWTTNRDLAKPFDTRAQANQTLHGRPGEIVGVDEAGEVLP